MNVEETLKDRDSKYGDFRSTATAAQHIKNSFREVHTYGSKLNVVQAECLDMIATKLARILTGNPDHADSWHDIAGYATLAEREILASLPGQANNPNAAAPPPDHPYPEQPPVDNAHVAPGCEKFTDDDIAANADAGSNVVAIKPAEVKGESFV